MPKLVQLPIAPKPKPRFELRDYQLAAKQILLDNPYHALHLPMAFGKTLVTLAALEEMTIQGHILVIAPLNIAKLTWVNEIKTFGFKLNHKSFLLNKNAKKLTMAKRYEVYEEALTDPPTMYFISIDLVEDLVEWMIQNSTYWPFKTIIIDEAQTIKNPSSNRFKALKKVRPDIQRVIELTGTPIPNGYLDLWAQVYILDQGLSLGPNITWYQRTFFDPVKFRGPVPTEFQPKMYAIDEIKRRTKHLISGAENKSLKLPEMMFNEVKLHLSDDLMNAYTNFKKEYIYNVATELHEKEAIANQINSGQPYVPSSDDIKEALIMSAGRLRQKLLQFASGQIYIDDEKNIDIVHDEKVEALKTVIEQADSNVLVAYRYQSEMQRILKELPEKYNIPVKRFDGSPKMLDDWNAQEIPVMLIHPASAGPGLNLQFGGHNLVWYTLPDSSESFDQTNHRLRRPGSQSNVININMLRTCGTEDDRQLPRINKKLDVQQDFLNSYMIDTDAVVDKIKNHASIDDIYEEIKTII